MATMEKDFQAENWWDGTTASGDPSWTDDYTRHRSGTLTHSGTEFGEVDMYNHTTGNQPTDVYIGRVKSPSDF